MYNTARLKYEFHTCKDTGSEVKVQDQVVASDERDRKCSDLKVEVGVSEVLVQSS